MSLGIIDMALKYYILYFDNARRYGRQSPRWCCELNIVSFVRKYIEEENDRFRSKMIIIKYYKMAAKQATKTVSGEVVVFYR